MRFFILGPVRAELRGQAWQLGRKRERALLAVLLNECGRTVSTERLIDLLWDIDQQPDAARRAVQVYIARTRASIVDGEVGIESVGSGYRLELDPDQVDVHRFRGLCQRAERTDGLRDRAALLKTALELSRGPALCGSNVGRIGDTLGRELDDMVQAATERWYETMLTLGDHRAQCAPLVRMAQENPERESVTRLAMLALYHSERAVEALRLFARCRTHLVDQFGVEPGPRLIETQNAILRSAPIAQRTGVGVA